MSGDTSTLDHIVHLTPPGSVEEASRQFRELGFKVLPGGVHAGGLTENALVVFEDAYSEQPYYPPGSPERIARDKNPWSKKTPGWVDFAFLGNGSHSNSISKTINERAHRQGGLDLYEPEQDGGRTRPDGEILKWLISGPVSGKRGVLPFFCGDVTPRELRVPTNPPSNAEHPSTAKGISFVRILVHSSHLNDVSKEIVSVIGEPPSTSTKDEAVWNLNTVNSVDIPTPRLILGAPRSKEETAFLESSKSAIGIYEVGFRVQKVQGGNIGVTPYGKFFWEE